MNEETVTTNIDMQANEPCDINQSLVDTITRLKDTTVSRDKYVEAVETNKKLLQALERGDYSSNHDKEKDSGESLEAIATKLFKKNSNLTNLEHAQLSLEYRDKFLDRYNEDPFAMRGKSYNPTEEDLRCAQKVADAYRSCIEYADGDPEVFNAELARITKDTTILKKRR